MYGRWIQILGIKENCIFICNVNKRWKKNGCCIPKSSQPHPLRVNWIQCIVRKLRGLLVQEVSRPYWLEDVYKVPRCSPLKRAFPWGPTGKDSLRLRSFCPTACLKQIERNVSKDRRPCHLWLFMSCHVVTCGILVYSPFCPGTAWPSLRVILTGPVIGMPLPSTGK